MEQKVLEPSSTRISQDPELEPLASWIGESRHPTSALGSRKHASGMVKGCTVTSSAQLCSACRAEEEYPGPSLQVCLLVRAGRGSVQKCEEGERQRVRKGGTEGEREGRDERMEAEKTKRTCSGRLCLSP